MNNQDRNWNILNRTLLHKTRVFDLYSQRMRSPDSSYEDDFFFLDCADWVVVVPVTKNKEVVLVKQYRHGVNQLCLEIPGGIMNDPQEAPADAALREMQEETGYTASRIISLGYVHPNPALQNNCCFLFLAEDAALTTGQNLDPSEDIEVELRKLSDVGKMIVDGEITHTLCVTAFFRMHLLTNPFGQ